MNLHSFFFSCFSGVHIKILCQVTIMFTASLPNNLEKEVEITVMLTFSVPACWCGHVFIQPVSLQPVIVARGFVFMRIKQVEHRKAIGFAAVIIQLGFLCISSVATPYEKGTKLAAEKGMTRGEEIFQQPQRQAKENLQHLCELQPVLQIQNV